ncbi:MAG: DUF1343 domain-containing protein [Deltaproteobacteria bacterium]|jgi:uncharacterized protein YbbC (DUF1343 family)|nr:DUF1343 domain-containing protein [Deltaproteobacteria bacterium]
MQKPPSRVLSGLSVFIRSHADAWLGKSLALLANQASVGPDRRHTLEFLDTALPGAVNRLFAPQHGFYGIMQDNMDESPHFALPDGRPVWSLYGETRAPEPRMLEGLDAVICDLQDVGVRVYTFAQTLFLMMEACARAGVRVIVLDRPNPSGGIVLEGMPLSPDLKSFVGMTPVPLRHGFTIGEHAIYRNASMESPCDLTVIPMEGWDRGLHFRETGLPWVMPSPNLPTPEACFIYPGSVIFEGTNLSEGRGTTRPFHLVGAPYVDARALADRLDAMDIPGTFFRPVEFRPMFGKWAGEICRGVEIHPLARSFRPFRAALAVLECVLRLWPGSFRLKEPPYEYETEKRPIDLIIGCHNLFTDLEGGATSEEICRNIEPHLKAFDRRRTDFLLYQD